MDLASQDDVVAYLEELEWQTAQSTAGSYRRCGAVWVILPPADRAQHGAQVTYLAADGSMIRISRFGHPQPDDATLQSGAWMHDPNLLTTYPTPEANQESEHSQAGTGEDQWLYLAQRHLQDQSNTDSQEVPDMPDTLGDLTSEATTDTFDLGDLIRQVTSIRLPEIHLPDIDLPDIDLSL